MALHSNGGLQLNSRQPMFPFCSRTVKTILMAPAANLFSLGDAG